MFMEGVMNTTCPAVAGNGTNCALAGVASKAIGMRKVALLRSRLSFSEDLPNLPCEQTIVVILLQHFQVHLAQRVRADQLQKLIKGGVGRETGRKAPPVDLRSVPRCTDPCLWLICPFLSRCR